MFGGVNYPETQLKTWVKTVGATAIAAIVFVGVKVIPPAGGFLAANIFIKKILNTETSPDEVEQALAKQGLTLFSVIKTELPSQYDGLMRQLIEIVENQSDEEEVFRKGYELLANFRKDHALLLRQAPQNEIRALITAQLEMIQIVQKREPASVCGNFALRGPIALNSKDKFYQKMFDDASVKMVKAIAAAKRSPTGSAAASEADWGDLFNAFSGTDEEWQLIANENIANPAYCNAVMKLYGAMLAMPGEAGSRVRAEMAYLAASG